MPYKTKNIIVLLSINLLVFLAGGYLSIWSYPNKINNSELKLNKLSSYVEKLDNLDGEYYRLDSLINESNAKLGSFDKVFITEVTFAKIYDYLNSILDYIGFLEFNMTFVKSEDFGDFGYNTYNIIGQGSFSRIFQFIWYIEKGPQLYKIEKLSLHSLEAKNPKTRRPQLVVPFQMEIRAYYTKSDKFPAVQRSLNSVSRRKISNPFQPAILRSLPPNTRNLIIVENAGLEALTSTKAMISYNGEIHVLKEGDRVYLGRLTTINSANNEVVFTLNKGGIIKKFTLKLQFEEENN